MHKADEKTVNRHIASFLRQNPKKWEQLDKVQGITISCTSDDHIHVQLEMYDNNIVRFLITGTRCNMVICGNALTHEIIRKPRNARPWDMAEYDTWVYRIKELV